MEVRLLHAALVERDLIEQAGHRVDGAAFHLGPDLIGIDRDAAVDRADELVDAELAVGRHRHLGDVGGVAAVGERHGDAAGAPGRQRRPPVRLRRGRLEHRLVPLGLAEERAAILVRILAGGVGQLVDEALGDERVL